VTDIVLGQAPWEVPPIAPGTGHRTSVLARVDRFRLRHPEIRVGLWYTTASGKTEVTEPGDAEPRTYDRTEDMIGDLEARYPA
jgi:hypothetical protein